MQTPSNSERDNCQAYLVRMWRDSPQEPWRASLKIVLTGRELHFVSPEKLFLFLHRQTVDPLLDSEDIDPQD